MKLLQRLIAGRNTARAEVALYAALVHQARQTVFYAECGVPDTLDGRFDMIALHAFLVMRRLKGGGRTAEAISRRLYELMVDDFDQSLREMGAGDVGVGKRVKAMVRGMQGRLMAYDRAFDAPGRTGDGPDPLEVALDNNLYGTVPAVEPAWLGRMAAYVRARSRDLAAQPLEEVLAGRLRFVAPGELPQPSDREEFTQ